jgi:hypothetical protein
MVGRLDPAACLRLPNNMPDPTAEEIDRFIAKWGVSGGHERGAAQHFLLTRLVALNHERAAEEKRGLIRWLRPEYQAPEQGKAAKLEQDEIELGTEEPPSQSKISNQQSTIVNQIPWPPGLAAQVAEIQKLLPATGANAMAISAFFGKRSKPREAQITEILETLRSLGKLE